MTLNLYILEQDKDINEIPPDDPIIPITLQAVCGGLGCRLGTTVGCISPCDYGCCAGSKSNYFQCRCDPG